MISFLYALFFSVYRHFATTPISTTPTSVPQTTQKEIEDLEKMNAQLDNLLKSGLNLILSVDGNKNKQKIDASSYLDKVGDFLMKKEKWFIDNKIIFL